MSSESVDQNLILGLLVVCQIGECNCFALVFFFQEYAIAYHIFIEKKVQYNKDIHIELNMLSTLYTITSLSQQQTSGLLSRRCSRLLVEPLATYSSLPWFDQLVLALRIGPSDSERLMRSSASTNASRSKWSASQNLSCFACLPSSALSSTRNGWN
jgi:hypothetical protein